jgi:hypothetical protein
MKAIITGMEEIKYGFSPANIQVDMDHVNHANQKAAGSRKSDCKKDCDPVSSRRRYTTSVLEFVHDTFIAVPSDASLGQ